jgi:two-component system chemotaxis response regulator CheY
MKVLIVEDDFASRRMMQKLLAPYGSVDAVVDGMEAIEAFRLAWEDASPYDAIFMDIMMPRMDGQTALRKIREAESKMGVNPIDEVKIFMTSVMDDPKNVIESYQEGGATGYLIKPIDIDTLRSELKRFGFTPQA